MYYKYNFDIEEIKQLVESVIRESQMYNGIPINVDQIIEKWLEAKSSFIEGLKGNLIYQSEEIVSFHLDKKSRQERLEKFADLIDTHYKNGLLSEYLYEIETEEFYNNKTESEYKFYDFDKEVEVIVPANIKVVKSFKFFETDPQKLAKMQNEASRLIQEDVVSGYLCYSVHPLDFLSASENIHNWRSCYALDGEYRTGCLNYLMDSSTVICYLRSTDDNVILPHFPKDVPWNSKKWRVWLFFSNDQFMFLTGRQYPFSNNLGLNYIKDNILPNVGMGEWGKLYNRSVSEINDEYNRPIFSFSYPLFPVNETLKSIQDLMIEKKHVHAYNDVLRSHHYHPSYAYKIFPHQIWAPDTGYTNKKTKFYVGDACPCPICGIDYIDGSDILACQSCMEEYNLRDIGGYYYCDCCGTSVPLDSLYQLTISGDQVCYNCYEREVVCCQLCSATDMPDVISYYNGMYLCPNCREKEKNKKKEELLNGKGSDSETESYRNYC